MRLMRHELTGMSSPAPSLSMASDRWVRHADFTVDFGQSGASGIASRAQPREVLHHGRRGVGLVLSLVAAMVMKS